MSTRWQRRPGLEPRGGIVPSMSLAPLVDVVFLLLLFLVLTARFLPREGAFRLHRMEPPAHPVERYLEPLHVEIRAVGEGTTLFVGGEEIVERARLEAIVASVPEQNPIVVSADDEVPYQEVIEVSDVCAGRGRHRVALGGIGLTGP